MKNTKLKKHNTQFRARRGIKYCVPLSVSPYLTIDVATLDTAYTVGVIVEVNRARAVVVEDGRQVARCVVNQELSIVSP